MIALLASRTAPDEGKISSGGALMKTVGIAAAARWTLTKVGGESAPRKLVTTNCKSNRAPPLKIDASNVTVSALLGS